jgi:hypothetical protein
MQRIAQGGPLPDGSQRTVRRKRRPRSVNSDGSTHAAGVTTLAPAFTLALPNLAGIRNSYSHEFHAELLYDLYAALVREGLGRPETWTESEGSAEPALGVVFNPREPEEVRRALRTVSRFVAFNCELFELVEELADWETCHAGAHLDRGESSIRVA